MRSERAPDRGTDPERRRASDPRPAHLESDSSGDLRCTVVRYSDEPDRCTLFPPGETGVALMSTWLSADYDAFVDLERNR